MPAESAVCGRNDADFDLIETLRWEPETGFVRLAAHLARLEHSARVLDFAAPDEPRAHLERAVGGSSPLRVRLTCSPQGRVAVTARPFLPLAEGTVWRLKIAARRLESADPFLIHKTTRRAVYEAARAEFPTDRCDEVLLLNERGEVCEGTITNLFVDLGDGPLFTPPVASGLLPGILRGTLLDHGQAIERVLREADLRAARRIFIGNSLRGLLAATLA